MALTIVFITVPDKGCLVYLRVRLACIFVYRDIICCFEKATLKE